MSRSTFWRLAATALALLAGVGSAAADVPDPDAQHVGPKPLGNPATWIATDDYPARALRENRKGTVRYRLDIDSNGTIANCLVVQSSGSPDLDEETCSLVTNRARFAPAHDAAGNPEPGTYSGSVRWTIPTPPPPHPYVVVTRFVVEADGTISDCQRAMAEGAAPGEAPLGKIPCPPAFSQGFTDAAGKSVRRQIIYTQSLAIEPVPSPAPGK